MNAKSIYIFLAGAVVAGLLVWGFLAMQPAKTADQVTDTDTTQTDTTGTGTNTGGTAVVTPGNPVAQNDHFLYTVNYNNGVFTPAVLTLKRGDSVKFVNKDNLTMKISITLSSSTSTASNMMDQHSVGKGGTYSVSLSVPGVWVIQNVNDTGVATGGGVINVR